MYFWNGAKRDGCPVLPLGGCPVESTCTAYCAPVRSIVKAHLSNGITIAMYHKQLTVVIYSVFRFLNTVHARCIDII
nr:MAG TPA: hypothetical protein [Caudoviricetes sp.]